MGRDNYKAAKLYGDAGLKVAEDFKDIPDHFASELEYMSYLIREEIKVRGLLAREFISQERRRLLEDVNDFN